MAHAAMPDANDIFELSPIPSLILSPSYTILKASKAFLEAWQVTSETCNGLGIFEFLASEDVMIDGKKTKHMKQVIDGAIAAHAVHTTGAVCTKQTTSWSARVIPIFSESVLLYVVLEWERQPTISTDTSLPTSGLSTDEAFRILVQSVKDYAIFLLD